MSDPTDVLMLHGVSAECADCGDERIFVPTDGSQPGEFCCTGCDAAVFLLAVAEPAVPRRRSRVA